MKKVDIVAEKMKKVSSGNKDIAAIAAQLNAKVDTSTVTFSGFGRSNIGREMEIVGQLFTAKKGDFLGPLTGNYGAYCVVINDISEPPAKEDFTMEKMQQIQNFSSRVTNSMYSALEKTAKITDNRLMFY
jgi:hypothetical protein